jgi:electron transport complex protein RnfB
MSLMLVTVSLAALTMLILSLLFGYVLGWANVKFAVEVDPRVEKINIALPGANCGGCGYVGCNDYAEAVALKGEDISKCSPGGAGVISAIASIMGVEAGETVPYRPVIHCVARNDDRLQRHKYVGEKTCIAANMVAGVQGCTYGCLGMGDCFNACKYDAIRIVNGLSYVIYDNCVGCGACAKVCPRNIISMIPFKLEWVLAVKCSTGDFGKEVMEVCKVGCIGCKMCAKNSDRITMKGNHPTVNYDTYDPKSDDFSVLITKCPRESLVFVGIPTHKHKEAVKDESLPERIEADFKTTVDDAEWRG